MAGAPYRAELRWGTLRKNCEDELVRQRRQTICIHGGIPGECCRVAINDRHVLFEI